MRSFVFKLLLLLVNFVPLTPRFIPFYNVLEWINFKAYHCPQYHESEDPFRMKNFFKVKKFIQDFNSRKTSMRLKLNSFACLNKTERQELTNLIDSYDNEELDSFVPGRNKYIGKSVDYREIGVITSVKNQMKCGSCWAHSTVAQIESQYIAITGKNISLSSQQIVDCAHDFDSDGCSGGTFLGAYTYMKKMGVQGGDEYPYHGSKGQCLEHEKPPVIKISTINTLTPGDENGLVNALFEHGPIAVPICANDDEFLFYSSGIYQTKKCPNGRVNHAMLLVGISHDPSEHYILKNSWGTMWGENGYMRLDKKTKNMCGILNGPMYADIKLL